MTSPGDRDEMTDEEAAELANIPFESDVLEPCPIKEESELTDFGGSPFGGSTKVHPESDGLW